MPDGQGYLRWDNFPVLDKGGALLSLGDHVLLGEINSWNETLTPAGLTLQTHGHTTILQLPRGRPGLRLGPGIQRVDAPGAT